MRLGGEFTWPQPFCMPFRRMIAEPQLLQRLDWILGPNARMDGACGSTRAYLFAVSGLGDACWLGCWLLPTS